MIDSSSSGDSNGKFLDTAGIVLRDVVVVANTLLAVCASLAIIRGVSLKHLPTFSSIGRIFRGRW